MTPGPVVVGGFAGGVQGRRGRVLHCHILFAKVSSYNQPN